MNLTQIEKETIILFNEGEPTATIYTHNEKLKAQFAEYTRQYPDVMTHSSVDEHGALHAMLPKTKLRILFRKPRSEKQQQVSMENARRFRERLQSSPSAEE
ncbi:molecular chaperone [Ruminococcaceae bacterium OttesenSCG-928-L11]|nr:molecular chaperone [Ruminococcaceae bacterium OttesenSCG-928-L11]